MTARHVLITGGAGFIGSNLADAFLARDWRVSVIDNFVTGERANVDARVELIEGDLRDAKTLDVIDRLKPDVISHQAAQVDVRISVADPAADAETNILASIRLLQKAKEAGVSRFVFASSGGAIYGEPVIAPQPESHPAMPLSPYGCAKLTVEHYMHYFREVQRLNTIALRYANVYGPRQSAKGEAGVVAIFANRLLHGEEVTINGSGEQTRDFVYVGDVVAANVAVAENAALEGPFNVGTGVEITINELSSRMAAIVGVSSEAQHGPGKAGEQMRSVLDARKLRELAKLGEPVAIDDGLRKTIDWFRLHTR
ncbi:MAG TPA: NAD-dependent epimerase/dehydratase family protein [Thermoanaerobaculia bacterium]|nr:NAD-dependent epimerase/dehydratase family protein [Thermoanaerobaculia bacterium]